MPCHTHTHIHTFFSVAPKDEAEAARLRALLAEFPTTEEEDRAELKRAFFFLRGRGRTRRGGVCLHRLSHTHLPLFFSIGLNNKRDWRKALILEFRATRKRALRLAAARAAGEDGGSTAGRVGGVGAEHNEL